VTSTSVVKGLIIKKIAFTQIWWSSLTRKKLTLSIEGEVLEEVKEAAAMSGRP
jgi:hypothetical protein